jgi:hypothetical protein
MVKSWNRSAMEQRLSNSKILDSKHVFDMALFLSCTLAFVMGLIFGSFAFVNLGAKIVSSLSLISDSIVTFISIH